MLGAELYCLLVRDPFSLFYIVLLYKLIFSLKLDFIFDKFSQLVVRGFRWKEGKGCNKRNHRFVNKNKKHILRNGPSITVRRDSASIV